jgi:hypothetical protein
MSEAVEAAVARGEAVTPKRSKWKPIGVENRGWLVARIQDTVSGHTEGVYVQQGTWFFYGVGQKPDGTYTSHSPSAELRKIARAMLNPGTPDEYDTLLRTATRASRTSTGSRRVRRKAAQ